ncbi:MAG TPA: DUF2339 domain-containing protein, partial [Planctomycetota bacterium]|nr:DUF2339 domain-containing protein [Planctomycetota bacterium]
AAVLGGIFLIVAGFLFLQYSIDRGWVTPAVRLITGAITGATCLVVAHFLRKREYLVLANSLSGAGIVLLYAVAWAAYRKYGMIGFPVAFAAMVATTALCAALSYRYASQLIAVFGLLGGFATPLVLSTGADHPIGLFGYALLLDLGFLFVAHRRRWPTIGMVALGGTFLIQGLWIASRMDTGELAIGVVALGTFGLLFSTFAAMQPAADRSRWIPSQVAALLLPFCFATYFAQRIDFGFHLLPLAALAGVMMLAGGILARLQKTPWLSIGTVSGALSLVLVWTFSKAHEFQGARALELVICALALAAIQLCFAEWEHRKSPTQRDAASAAAFACLGLLIACSYACGWGVVPLSSWLVPLVLLPLALLRLYSFGAHFALALLGSFASGAGIAFWAGHEWPGDDALNLPGPLGLACIVLPIGLALLVAARWLRAEIRPSAFFAVSVFFPMVMFAVCQRSPSFAMTTERAVSSGALAAAILGLGLAMALAANGARSAHLFAVAVGVTLVAQVAVVHPSLVQQARSPDWAGLISSLGFTALAFTLWPFLAPRAMAARAGTWGVAALASTLFFPAVHVLWVERHGGGSGFAMPLAFALLVGACAVVLGRRGEPEADARARALESDPGRRAVARTLSIARAWFGAVALLYASCVLPLALDPRGEVESRHTLAVVASIWSLALAAWWRKSDHRALKYAAGLIAVFVALHLFNFAMETEHESAARIVFSARGYWLLVPAIALLAGSILVGARELSRMRGSEIGAMPAGLAPATAALAGCGTLLAFCFVNLEVADAFSSAQTFRWTLHGGQQANLAQSIAWALFAIALLILGVSRELGALRWTSLLLFLATIAKVFLLDLAHLGGLYRVGSILGLALSLLLVSFLYQRFVFRRARTPEPDA